MLLDRRCPLHTSLPLHPLILLRISNPLPCGGPYQECDAFQEECLREESRYHYLNSLISIMDANLEKVGEEE